MYVICMLTLASPVIQIDPIKELFYNHDRSFPDIWLAEGRGWQTEGAWG